MELKVATYNIRAGLSDGYFKKKNYYKAAEVVTEINADVISLNEVGKRIPEQIREHAGFLAEQCGYKYYHFAKAAMFGPYPYGNALLSKYPIDRLSVIPVKKFINILPGIYEPRCILSAQIRLDKPLRVICTHLGLFPDEQQLGISKVTELLKGSSVPTVFMGDMNISGSKPTITTKMGLNMQDACVLRERHLKTYPSARPTKRLDYIFVNDPIEVRDVYVVDAAASDHLPLVAEISI